MTTTRWTTTGSVPLNAWSALGADLRTLLAVMAQGGATVTSPAGNTGPVFTDSTIAFAVTLPGRGPLAVTFHRDAGDGEVETSSPLTDGLVLAAVGRASRHWGQLVTVTSDAGTEARAICTTITDGLFGAGDRAVAGGASLDVPGRVARAVAQAQDAAAAAERAAVTAARAGVLGDIDPFDVTAEEAEQAQHAEDAARFGQLTYLDAVIADLTAQRTGTAEAAALLTPPAKPAPVPPSLPAPELPTAPDVDVVEEPAAEVTP